MAGVADNGVLWKLFRLSGDLLTNGTVKEVASRKNGLTRLLKRAENCIGKNGVSVGPAIRYRFVTAACHEGT